MVEINVFRIFVIEITDTANRRIIILVIMARATKKGGKGTSTKGSMPKPCK